MRMILLMAGLGCFFSWTSFAFQMVNGSSTVGTLMVAGLTAGSEQLEVASSFDEVYARPSVEIGLTEETLRAPNEHELLGYYEVLEESDATELVPKLEPARIGSLNGFYGIHQGKNLWLVPTALGKWVVLVQSTESNELMDEFLFSLRHPKTELLPQENQE